MIGVKNEKIYKKDEKQNQKRNRINSADDICDSSVWNRCEHRSSDSLDDLFRSSVGLVLRRKWVFSLTTRKCQ